MQQLTKIPKIYFDHNATTPLHPEVLEVMMPFLTHKFGNPSSSNFQGQEIRDAIENSRTLIANFLNCNSSELIFTSSGSESNNLALKGFLSSRKIITSQIEHASIIETAKYLEHNIGYRVHFLSVNHQGVVDLLELETHLAGGEFAESDRPCGLISVMAANNETGVLQPLTKILELGKKYNFAVHSDAVQALGNMEINLKELPLQMLTLSAHKVQGPMGVGVLFVRGNMALEALIHGGHQERNLRAGSENVAGIVGFGKAISLIEQSFKLRNSKLSTLRDYFEKKLMENFKGQIKINGQGAARTPNCSSISFKTINAQILLEYLNQNKIAVSTGSACLSWSCDQSHVIKAMGVDDKYARGTLRFSFGDENTLTEVDKAIAILKEFFQRANVQSPYTLV
ncbi:MAG: cysteine desulfurase [Oligoflexia bacterium]|nr:cysteine desulfurase [Oligoflexia bacterium]